MAISCKKIEFQTNRQTVNAKALDRSSQLALARVLAGLTSITCPNVCGRGHVPYISAYCHSVYRYKRMRLLTRLYGIDHYTQAQQNHTCI